MIWCALSTGKSSLYLHIDVPRLFKLSFVNVWLTFSRSYSTINVPPHPHLVSVKRKGCFFLQLLQLNQNFIKTLLLGIVQILSSKGKSYCERDLLAYLAYKSS